MAARFGVTLSRGLAYMAEERKHMQTDIKQTVEQQVSPLRAEISDALKLIFPGLMILTYGVLLMATHLPRTW